MFERENITRLKCDKAGCSASSEPYANAAEAVSKAKGWGNFGFQHYCPDHWQEFVEERKPKPLGE